MYKIFFLYYLTLTFVFEGNKVLIDRNASVLLRNVFLLQELFASNPNNKTLPKTEQLYPTAFGSGWQSFSY